MKRSGILALLSIFLALPLLGQQAPANPLSSTQQLVGSVSYGQGEYSALSYNYATNVWSGGGSANTTYSIQPFQSFVVVPGGRNVAVFSANAPITIGQGAIQETVTPTSVSTGCYSYNIQPRNCTITAAFTYAHGKGDLIVSGSIGLQEAINDAFSHGGGLMEIDPLWTNAGGTNALITAATPYQTVTVVDYRKALQYWNVQQTGATFLAAPATLTAVTALASATPVGAYGTGTYYMCVSYVDINGQEGPCSATFSQAGLATGSFIFTAPVASTGAVGYTIYISLTSGTYSLAYQVPLTSTICTLTTIETTTPACAVANTTYGQSGATATVTAITVATSPVDMQLGGVSGTLLTGNPNGRTTYGYVPSSHMGSAGIPTVNLAFTAGGIGSATPISVGTVNMPAGILNYVGKRIRVCGKFINTDVNSTIQNINIYWDAAGSNSAGSPVKIGSLQSTGTGAGTAATYSGDFCEEFTTTVSAATATGASAIPGFNFLNYYLAGTPAALFVGGETGTAAVGSLNLNGTTGFSNRLSIVHTNTTGNATPTLQALTIEVL